MLNEFMIYNSKSKMKDYKYRHPGFRWSQAKLEYRDPGIINEHQINEQTRKLKKLNKQINHYATTFQLAWNPIELSLFVLKV